MSAEGWSALATGIAVIVAISAIVIESRRARFSHSLQIMGRLDERFESLEFRETRRRAAAYLISRGETDPHGEAALRDVLNFFDTIGFLFRRKAVDAQTVWHYFSSWILPYYSASSKYLHGEQKRDPLCYREIEPLYNAVFAIEERERHYVDASSVTSKEAVERMLREEAILPRNDHAGVPREPA